MGTEPKDPASPIIEGGRLMFSGLTKREYFAAMAIQGTIAAHNQTIPDWIGTETADSHAKAAIRLADALIAALNK